MKWTQEVPTKEGWYWIKPDEMEKPVTMPYLLPSGEVPYSLERMWYYGPLKAPKFDKPKVKPEQGWPRFRDLPDGERQRFMEFMNGQTRPFIPGLEPGENDFYYPWDYDNFKSKKPYFD